MINKVKPFYIKITDDITPQMVQDVFDKCVDAGAYAGECIERTERKHKYSGCHGVHFGYFGINDAMETFLGDKPNHFHEHAQEITPDQLDEWLGVAGGSPKQEWKNGDECVFADRNGKDKTCKVIGLFPPFVESYVLHCESSEPTFFISNAGRMKKPETPEQKAERERMEAAYDLYCEECKVMKCSQFTFNEFKGEHHLKARLLAIVDKTNYRKK